MTHQTTISFRWTYKFVPSTTNFFLDTSLRIDVSLLESVDGSIIVEGTTLELIKFPYLQQIKPKDDGRSKLLSYTVFNEPWRRCEHRIFRLLSVVVV